MIYKNKKLKSNDEFYYIAFIDQTNYKIFDNDFVSFSGISLQKNSDSVISSKISSSLSYEHFSQFFEVFKYSLSGSIFILRAYLIGIKFLEPHFFGF